MKPVSYLIEQSIEKWSRTVFFYSLLLHDVEVICKFDQNLVITNYIYNIKYKVPTSSFFIFVTWSCICEEFLPSMYVIDLLFQME